ncbi:MAG: hypothetical protein UV83_C0016G0001 [candidate division WWE3 bacterium GW2011_GWE2_43_18]|uniref:Uncharacterized protein n=3 Tax=Katanobacteria TaxID=422282 RepID=A0A1F4XDK0_UNCKA|nr:MAG: hypothetical protein UU59_C0010G0003 [candidate division WWE3 bacterium GW2011_GWE1_41_27]KKS60602.1 MAG: hypothetical protein UV26_C0003G0056 [candidate division WWE3 bacterium GW2011_GWF2_42_42]KKT04065.1 MAG: hypothetical protein UV83_C0016G0001 [candidate division WWE3 bacterium GW2011_GWE2_43_18]OGC79738.1 MAG: hypothetical protein A3K01_00520 [candidate division WWE3 bacterium RIFOXYD1_FULL_43_17]
MRIYIGYKYTNVADKQALIQKLLEFSSFLEKAGHQTFILGRDIQNWQGSLPLWKTFPAIIGNMLKSDAFVAYITSPVPSKGLEVEKALSAVLGKKRLFVTDSLEGDATAEDSAYVSAGNSVESTASDILAKLK